MYKISELVGKNLLDVNSAQDFGQISDYIYDKATGVGAFATDTGRYSAKIFSVKDAVSVTDATQQDVGEKLVGKVAYDTTGKYLGKIYEVEFNGALKPSKITLIDGTDYSRGKIYAVKDVALIRAKTPARPKRTAPTTLSATPDNAVEHTLKRRSVNARWLQNRKYGDFSFLIGKITDKTITNFQGEVMVKQGEKVTQEILRQAKISGKLIELCLHTK